jgi:hypothetical protein
MPCQVVASPLRTQQSGLAEPEIERHYPITTMIWFSPKPGQNNYCVGAADIASCEVTLSTLSLEEE